MMARRLDEIFPAKKKETRFSSNVCKRFSSLKKDDPCAKSTNDSPLRKTTLGGVLASCTNDIRFSQGSALEGINTTEPKEEYSVHCIETEEILEEEKRLQNLRPCTASKACNEESCQGISGHTKKRRDLETLDSKECEDSGQRNNSCCISLADHDVAMDVCPQVEACEAQNKANLHLSQFANEFLSICCSGIGLDENLHVKFTSDKDLLHAKRNFNSLSMDIVDLVTVKKQRMDGSVFQVKNLVDPQTFHSLFPSDASVSKLDGLHIDKDVKDMALKGNCYLKNDPLNASAVLRVPNEINGFPSSSTQLNACRRAGEKNDLPVLTYDISNSGSKTCPNNEMATPRPCSSKKAGRITPKGGSLSGWFNCNSLYSPGDAFWEEAIEVTDGLLMHGDKDSVEALQERNLKVEVNQTSDSLCTPVNYFDPTGETMGGSRKQNDDNSMSEPRTALKLEPVTKSKVEFVGCESVIPEVQEDSPLPIRRFDFSLTENPLYNANASIKAIRQEKHPQSPNDQLSTYEVNNEGVHVAMIENDSLKANQCELLEENTVSVLASTESILYLSHWLPPEACEFYATKGLKRLYPWQVDCLQIDGVMQGKNFVYCASTSAGKSLVAEILMLRQVLLNDKKAMLVLPYVALCSEKAEYLESLLGPLGKRVRSFFGTQGSANLPKDTSVAICTIEKANFLVNKLLEEGRLSEIAILIIDELHMVGDKERGYLLELMLTKLRYAAGLGENDNETSKNGLPLTVEKLGTSLQIVGMSATMSNVRAVASWLQAAFYETTFRPVPLDEFVKVGSTIYNKDMEVVRTVSANADLGGKDPEHVVELCHEVVRDGQSVLLFCSSRRACEMSAQHVAKYFSAISVPANDKITCYKDVSSAVEELRKSPAGLDPILSETLPAGVAYHHAGLTAEEREVVETCYRQGVVRVLAATSTLAAGVNLPARRVIFRQPKVGRDFLDGTRYRQMAGRAGRAGIDVKGESIMICKVEELHKMLAIMRDGCQPLQSCLAEDKNGMMRALLEVVAGGMVQSADDVHRYVRCTLLNSTQPFEEVVRSAQDSLRWLCHKKLVEWDHENEMYASTPLGKATFGSSLSPDESLLVFEDLAKAREGFVLASDLHMVYLVTPIYVDMEPDWGLFYQRFIELSTIEQTVGNRVGVTEPFLMRMAHGAPVMHLRSRMTRNRSPKYKSTTSKSPNCSANGSRSRLGRSYMEQTLRASRRFFVALMLSKLVQEVPLMQVCDSFHVPRGTVQALQDSAGRFAAMISAFCGRLGWLDFEGLVSRFQNRVSFGVRAEIVDLTQIPFVKAVRARALYKAGLRTVQAVAEATMPELMKALFDTSGASRDGVKATHNKIQLGAARKIKNAACHIVLERAEEARVAAFTAVQALGLPNCDVLSRPLSTCILYNAEDNDDSFMSEVQRNISDTKKYNGDNETEELLDNKTHASDRKSSMSEAENFTKSKIMSCKSVFFGGSGIAQVYSKSTREESTVALLDEGPKCVDNLSGGFETFVKKWQAEDEFIFDLHFKEYNICVTDKVFEISGMAICWANSPVYYLSLVDNSRASTHEFNASVCETSNNGCTSTELRKMSGVGSPKEFTVSRWSAIQGIFQNKHIRKVVWDLKSQLCVLKSPIAHNCGVAPGVEKLAHDSQKDDLTSLSPIDLEEPFIDVRVAAWLLWPDEESNHRSTLEQMVKKRIAGETAAAASRAGRWMNQMSQISQNGCCRRAAQVRALHLSFWKLLASEGLHGPLLKIEMPLVKVLAFMETSRLGVDMETCRKYKSLVGNKIKLLEEKAHQLVGMKFSLDMPADISSVLYKHLKLPLPPGCIKGKQHPKTDKHALEYLRDQHPIVEIVREHRVLSKLLHSTIGCIATWARQPIFDNVLTIGKKLHMYCICGHWLQTSTATGRLSMENPNLQCVEHPISFVVDKEICNFIEGSDSVMEVNARKLFIPTQDNWVLMSADYSQIEVRLMAHFSGDSHLITLLENPSVDLFRLIAAHWTGQTESSITKKQREHTKRLVYGILYGMGVNTLAKQLECSAIEANGYLEKFKASFPGVSDWLQQVVQNCRKNGYIKTLGGRKRYLDKINNQKRVEQAKAERQAVNSICQGSAADLIKVAMIKLYEHISGMHAKESRSSQEPETLYAILKGRCRMLLQIHDELLLEVEDSAVKEAGIVIRRCMEEAASLRVPLRVKLQAGPSWGMLKALDV